MENPFKKNVEIPSEEEIKIENIEDNKETELGKVMDRIFNGQKLGNGKGGISFLTKDVINRINLTKDAFVMALISHINGEIWK